MNVSLKRKISIRISIVFSLLFAAVMSLVYFSFNDFRREEFENRFKQRLVFTARFIAQSKDFDEEAPIFFNENSDNVLLNEQILIFNQDKKLIYSTVKDENIQWDDNLLEELDKKNTIYKENSVPEIYAAFRIIKGKKYYILTSAMDSNGVAKLNYLKYLLLFSFFITVFSIGFLSYYLIGKYLNPLEKLNEKIAEISAGQVMTPLLFVDTKDEIAMLTQSFNTMIARLNKVFDSQKSFASSASHEIRTPLTRMAFRLENLIQEPQIVEGEKLKLQEILQDIYQLSDLTQSLLLLAKMEEHPNHERLEEVRIDEVLFNAYNKVETLYPKLQFDFSIAESISEDAHFTVLGIQSLLEIVFVNLFKNAYLYSKVPKVSVLLNETDYSIYVHVDSLGDNLSSLDQNKIFQAFSRGENAQNIQGSGLGLRIVKRILDFQAAEIRYEIPEIGLNRFTISFKKKISIEV